jgi:hypothetical protein
VTRSRTPTAPRAPRRRSDAPALFDAADASLLDLLDRTLNKGVVAWGDVTLGVAGVDLVYLRLSALLGAADRLLSPQPRLPARRGRSAGRRR